MTINSPLIEKILKIQNIENIDNNKLLILTLSIATAKTTGFKQIKEHVFPEKEFENLIDILNTNSILTKVDISLLDKLKKTKVKKIENFDIEIDPNDFKRFSVIALGTIGVCSSMIISIIEKGDIRGGLKYIPAFTIISIVLYFIFMVLLSSVFGNMI